LSTGPTTPATSNSAVRLPESTETPVCTKCQSTSPGSRPASAQSFAEPWYCGLSQEIGRSWCMSVASTLPALGPIRAAVVKPATTSQPKRRARRDRLRVKGVFISSSEPQATEARCLG
jgi:hypothetical protein